MIKISDRFWRGGTATWDGTAGSKWAATAGGATGAAVPTAADDVYFDSSSTGTCTLSASSVCRSFQELSGFTGTVSHPAAVTLTIGDSSAGAGNVAFKLVSGSTYTLGNATTSALSFVSTSATQQTIDTGGKTVGNVTMGGAGSSYLLASAPTSTGAWTFNFGTFDTGNYNMTADRYDFGSSGTRRLIFGSSTLTANRNVSNMFFYGGNTSLTVDANTATFYAPNSVTSNGTFSINGFNWNGVSILTGPLGAAFNGTGLTTFKNITVTGGANKVAGLITSHDITLTGTLTVTGNSRTERVLIASATSGTARTVTAAAVSLAAVDFMDITAAGAANWNLASITNDSGDCGGNTGITFTTAATQTSTGTSSFTWSTHGWTSRVPLPQDDVVIANSFASGQTGVSVDVPRMGKNITITATGNAAAISYSSFSGNHALVNNCRFFGNFTTSLASSGNQLIVAAGRGTYTFTSNGKDQPVVNVDCGSGTYTFTDDLTFTSGSANDFNVVSGTANTRNITAPAVSQTGGTWNPGAYTLSCWRTSGNTGTFNGGTFNGSSATITYTATSASSRTFSVFTGTWALGTFDYSIAASTGTLVWTISTVTTATVGTIKVGSGRTLTCQANAYLIADTWQVDGATIASSSGTRVAYISRRYGGPLTFDSVTLTRIACVQPNGLYATNSTDGGGNLNTTFAAAPTGRIYRLQSAYTYSGSSVTTITATLPRAATAGNMLVAALVSIGSPGTVTGPSGWTVGPVSQFGSSTSVRFYTKLATGVETSVTTTNTSSNSQTMLVYELAGFQGTPTVDVSDGNTNASATSLSTAGTAPTNTAVPAYVFSALSVNAAVTSVAATNSFAFDYTGQVASSVNYFAAKQLTTLAPVSTTFSWTTARQAAAGMLVIKDVASASFLMFMQ